MLATTITTTLVKTSQSQRIPKTLLQLMSRFSIQILNFPVKSLISNCLITALRAFIRTLSTFLCQPFIIEIKQIIRNWNESFVIKTVFQSKIVKFVVSSRDPNFTSCFRLFSNWQYFYYGFRLFVPFQPLSNFGRISL